MDRWSGTVDHVGQSGNTKALREERQPARQEVDEVADGILRIQLPISLPGLGHVNCYALEDADGVALVDPGLPGQRTWRTLKKQLKSIGIPTSRVHTVVVTHSHPDHFGQVGRFRKKNNAKVITHKSFRTFLDPEAEADDEDIDIVTSTEQGNAQRENTNPGSHFGQPTPWGGKPYQLPMSRRLGYKAMSWAAGRFIELPKPTVRVTDSDVISLGKREWVAVHTPGHTEDHLCLWDPASGVFISGDHVLPTITPHISGLGSSVDPLADFFSSLDRVGDLPDVTQVLPAHGMTFSGLSDRCCDITRHHHERLDILRDTGREIGLGTVEDYMKTLFKERSWGSMAESETYAHLEHLRLTDQASTDNSKPQLRYRISD